MDSHRCKRRGSNDHDEMDRGLDGADSVYGGAAESVYTQAGGAGIGVEGSSANGAIAGARGAAAAAAGQAPPQLSQHNLEQHQSSLGLERLSLGATPANVAAPGAAAAEKGHHNHTAAGGVDDEAIAQQQAQAAAAAGLYEDEYDGVPLEELNKDLPAHACAYVFGRCLSAKPVR